MNKMENGCGLSHCIEYITAVINMAMIKTTTAKKRHCLEIIIPILMDGFGVVDYRTKTFIITNTMHGLCKLINQLK